jgi:hypothetical protein
MHPQKPTMALANPLIDFPAKIAATSPETTNSTMNAFSVGVKSGNVWRTIPNLR